MSSEFRGLVGFPLRDVQGEATQLDLEPATDFDQGTRLNVPVLTGRRSEIAAAEAAGDWKVAGRLKAEQLLGVPDHTGRRRVSSRF